MGIRADKTDRMFFKNEVVLLKELYKLNKFSKHLSQKELKEKEDVVEQIHLQAICISELGRVVNVETGTPQGNVIKGMELTFEKTRNKWNCQDSMYFYHRLGDSKRLTSYTVANMLKRICAREFGVEDRVIKNHRHYMSNGYKEIIRKGVLWKLN